MKKIITQESNQRKKHLCKCGKILYINIDKNVFKCKNELCQSIYIDKVG